MINNIVNFIASVECDQYVNTHGVWVNTKEVVIEGGLILDKYRGSANGIAQIRDIFAYPLVDFYLIKKDDDLYHVLPTKIVKIVKY